MIRYALWDKGVVIGILFTDSPDLPTQIAKHVKAVVKSTEENTPNATYCINCGGLKK